MDPLAKGNHILSNDIRSIAVASDLIGEDNISLRIHDRNGRHLGTDRIDDENAVSTNRSLQQGCLQMHNCGFGKVGMCVFF